jgi:hypothetical protein
MNKIKRSAFTTENQPRRTPHRGRGRPSKPKDRTLLQRVYDEIDKRIDSDIFKFFDEILKEARKKDAPFRAKELGVKICLELLDKRLPKKTELDLDTGLTIIIENPIPGLSVPEKDGGNGSKDQVLHATQSRSTSSRL